MCQIHFFHDRQHTRFNTQTNASEPGFPRPIAGHWEGLPPEGVDAALTSVKAKTYFFRGSQYYRFDHKTNRVDPGYPKAIADHWPGLPSDRIDACINWGNGKAYFFRKNQFWRYDIAADSADPGYPKKIADFWKGLPPEGVTGAINLGNGKAFFFRGDQCWRYDIKTDRADPGYPRPVAAVWPGLPATGVRAPVVLGYAGFDRLAYPGDETMKQLWETTNLTWTGFYLAPAPSRKTSDWMTRHAFLRNLGWGIAPVYVGQQQIDGPGSHNLSAAQGTLDAADAIKLAVKAGIPPGSVLYLDIETGGPIEPGMKQYYQAWVQGVVDGGWGPGVYCSYRLAGQFLKLDNRPKFWVFRVSKTAGPYPHPYPAPEPIGSAVPFASAWQHIQAAGLLFGANGKVTPVDFDSCCRRDPSII